jgi:hypothetical protein
MEPSCRWNRGPSVGMSSAAAAKLIGERRHRGLARHRVAVRRAIPMMPESECPHPWRSETGAAAARSVNNP